MDIELARLTVGTTEATESRNDSSSSSPKSASLIPERTTDVETRIVKNRLGGEVIEGPALGCEESTLGLVVDANGVDEGTGLCEEGCAVVGCDEVGCFAVGCALADGSVLGCGVADGSMLGANVILVGKSHVGAVEGSADGVRVVGELPVGTVVDGGNVEG